MRRYEIINAMKEKYNILKWLYKYLFYAIFAAQNSHNKFRLYLSPI